MSKNPDNGFVGRTVILASGERARIRRVVEDDELYIVDPIGEDRRADARDRLVLAKSVKIARDRDETSDR